MSDDWLAVADMPSQFRPGHLGRAAARFDDAQLTHWQKETIAHMSTVQVAEWLGISGDRADFAELIRHNVVLPKDAAPWVAAVLGEPPELGERERRIVDAAGKDFFAAAAAATLEAGSDFKEFGKLLKQRTGRKGADLFMPLRVALTGQLHGPELAPMFKLIPQEIARRRFASHA
jgi:glutamyl-tRNA synthetase